MIDPQVSAPAKEPNYAHLATSMADGSPHSSAVWVDADAVSPSSTRVRGEVVEIRGEPEAREWLDARALEYTGEPYPETLLPEGGGALLVIRPDRATAYSSSFRHSGRKPLRPG